VIGIEAGGAHKAYPLPALQKQFVVNDMVGSAPVLLVYAAASDTVTAFSRVLSGRMLTFKGAGGSLTDDETGSKWTAYGECTSGKLKGQKLNVITPQGGFWFAWAEFYPDTQIWGAAAGSDSK
jgi:hypothetical protein